MPTAIIMDFEKLDGDPLELYDAVMTDMDLGGILPAGALRHVAGATETGLRVVDVWEDMETFGRFAAERIAPLTARHGIGEPVVQAWEVSFEAGAEGDPGFLHVVDMPGVDEATYGALDAAVLAGGGLPAGLFWRASGPVDGGYRAVGAWVSREARDAFVETRIRPALEAAGAAPQPRIEEIEVHNSLSKVAAPAA